MSSAPREPKPSEPGKTPGRPLAHLVPGSWIWVLVLFGIGMILLFRDQFATTEQIDYGLFKRELAAGNVTNVKIGTAKITGEFKKIDSLPEDLRKKLNKDSPKFAVLRPTGLEDRDLIAQLDERLIKYTAEQESMPWLGPLVTMFILPLLVLLILFFVVLPRLRDPLGGSFLSNYIKSPARRYEKTKLRVTFDDVAGMENAKQELYEVVDFLRTPDKYQKLGGQIPKGVLLVGPPGTGKTLLARATAGEAGVPFFSIGGSEFIQMFVGVGASRVRDLFKTARENAPCILFIDEIDAVGRVRGAGLGGGHDEREQTLNQILSEMDGFLPTESVIVLAATNRPDVLDPALLRPGRFDRHITIDRPTWQGRMAILKVHTRDKPLADDVNLEMIARAMIGMTGADLRNLANEAALIATRQNKNKIERRDFEAAADRVMIGSRREELLSEDEKRRTAFHEAGHALVTWHQPNSDRPHKVSIIPRGQALGVNVTIPEEDRHHHSEEFFFARLVAALGGRAADRLVYNQTYSGAESDLKQATRIARLMVTHWGMSDKVGPVAYRVGEEHVFLGKEIQQSQDYSEGTAQLIDEEVRAILRRAEERAFAILSDHRHELDLLVEALLQREELNRDEIDELLRTGRLPLQEPASEPEPTPPSRTGSPTAEPAGVS
ncbi:MAG TPA: ATP-dependent zinc metalloprotease FtsH [Gemmatales bacterium]|nr:ATP-dependent zinc metalloprotease FtsH [Gemmatales bacterium]